MECLRLSTNRSCRLAGAIVASHPVAHRVVRRGGGRPVPGASPTTVPDAGCLMVKKLIFASAEHQKRFTAPPDFFPAGGFSAAMAAVAAVTKAKSTDTEKLIEAMEGLEFDTPKGKMVFRKEDHQALQSMYHFKVKVDPNVAWAVLEPVRELKIEDMNVPIRNKR